MQKEAIDKKSQLLDLVNSPTFQNIINVLAPFVTNYNIRQAVGLLQHLNDEVRMSTSPYTRPVRRV